MFVVATACAIITAKHFGASLALPGVTVTGVLTACLLIVMFERIGLYNKSLACDVRDELYQTVAALVITATPFLLLFTLIPPISTSRMVVLISLGFAGVTIPAMRGVIYQTRICIGRDHLRPILFVGMRQRVDAVVQRMRAEGIHAVALETNVDGDSDSNLQANEDRPWLCCATEIGARTVVFTEVIVPAQLRAMLTAARHRGIRLAFAPPRIVQESYEFGLETIGSQTLLVANPLPATRTINALIKRCLDVTCAITALLGLGPIMLLCALAVYVDTGRPVLYRQSRVGKDGSLFEILKFRSMPLNVESATGAQWSPAGDTRATRVGKILRRMSFDELPQLLNVLRGEMSIVGPRPERPMFVDKFRRQFARYDERHLVRPGITGWSHVHMKRNHDQSLIGVRLKYDLYYIENWSVFMDVSVIVKTAFEFLFHAAA